MALLLLPPLFLVIAIAIKVNQPRSCLLLAGTLRAE
jgi:lipopolysaccharide/colanic/teichoic acid biosynthesis glycosyltransferase